MKNRLFVIIPIILICLLFGGILLTKQVKAAQVKESLKLGNKYLQEGKYQEAILAFEKVIKIEPKNVEARVGLAKAYIGLGKYEEAEAALKDAISINEKKIEPYLVLGELYVSRGRLEEAVSILEKAYEITRNDEIKKFLDRIKALLNPPKASLEGGKYDKEITVTLDTEGREGSIYYTLDGSIPTSASIKYDKPIKLSEGNTALKALVIYKEGNQSKMISYLYNIKIPRVVVSFEDKEFEKMIRIMLDSETGEIYNTDLENVASVEITGKAYGSATTHYSHDGLYQYNIDDGEMYSERGGIRSLKDLKWFPNLRTINIQFNEVEDISTLKELPNLSSAYLAGNKISDISVFRGLNGILHLDLSDNPISDYTPIQNLEKLKYLSLMCSKLENVDFLQGLKNIKTLRLYSNRLTDLTTIATLEALDFLDISNNLGIKDISLLKGLKNLKHLLVNDYNITNQADVEEFRKAGVIK